MLSPQEKRAFGHWAGSLHESRPLTAVHNRNQSRRGHGKSLEAVSVGTRVSDSPGREDMGRGGERWLFRVQGRSCANVLWSSQSHLLTDQKPPGNGPRWNKCMEQGSEEEARPAAGKPKVRCPSPFRCPFLDRLCHPLGFSNCAPTPQKNHCLRIRKFVVNLLVGKKQNPETRNGDSSGNGIDSPG